jgi:hypothetical protein
MHDIRRNVAPKLFAAATTLSPCNLGWFPHVESLKSRVHWFRTKKLHKEKRPIAGAGVALASSRDGLSEMDDQISLTEIQILSRCQEFTW